MVSNEIELYAAPTEYRDCPQLRGIKLDHTWLSSECGPHNWNCYGRGRGNNKDHNARRLGLAHGNLAWMAEVYGPGAEGRSGRNPGDPAAAGAVELLHGVCQNVSNRMLAMTVENLDVSKAGGNELVVLAFGKYGFGVEKFIERLKKTADRLNAVTPGIVSKAELDRTLANVKAGMTVGAEFDALTDDLPIIRDAFRSKTTSSEKSEFAKEYAAFQHRRAEMFLEIEKSNLPNHDARGKMAVFLKAELGRLLGKVQELLGSDVYAQVVSVVPGEAWNALTTIM